MLKNFLIITSLSLCIFFQSCDGYESTDSGLKYKLLVDSAGKNAEMGDMVIVHLKFQNEKDTLDTYKRGNPINIFLQAPFKGSLEEGLTYASKGDSISIKVSNDSLYTKIFGDSLPKEIKPGSYTTFNVKVVDHYNKEQIKVEQQKYLEQQKTMLKKRVEFMTKMKQDLVDTSKAQMKIDDGIIKGYLKKNKLNAQRTENGVYYIITQPGTGEKADLGDSVSVQYVGKLLDGTTFDASRPGNPFTFPLGVGAAIPGFDEAIVQLTEGAKATIIIPSSLAYRTEGAKGQGGEYLIPPNAPLMFDIEIVDVAKAK
jgi:FKBP-type peptidyl-prolyl cis-trans isomerase FkpA